MRQLSVFERMLPVKLQFQVDIISNFKFPVRTMSISVLLHSILRPEEMELEHIDDLFPFLQATINNRG